MKSIYKSNERHSFVQSLKEKLEKIVSNVEWDYYDAVEHDYCGPLQIKCLSYYVTGRICKMMLTCKEIESCNSCKTALTSRTCHVITEEVNFTNLNIEDGEYLTHPNVGLYRFVQNLEKIYQRHCSSSEVAYNVADEAVKEGIPNYPCEEHNIFVISEIVKTFLLLRIRRVIRDFKDVEKINQHKKNCQVHEPVKKYIKNSWFCKMWFFFMSPSSSFYFPYVTLIYCNIEYHNIA